MSQIVGNIEKQVLTNQFKKSYTSFSNALNLVQNEFGIYECYYDISENGASAGYHTSQCSDFWTIFLSKMNIIQKCEGESCYPVYKTRAQVLSQGGTTLKNNNCTFLLANYPYAYMLADGSILRISDKNVTGDGTYWIYFVLDVNGKKKPNKWGYDLFYMGLSNDSGSKPVIDSVQCALKEKGGYFVNELLLK